MILGCAFFLWEWSPSWLDPRVDRFLMLIDPAGFRWLNETQLKVDRGVRFYNNASIPLDRTIIANRLIFLMIGLGSVALSQRHFARTLRGVSRRAERAWKPGRVARGPGRRRARPSTAGRPGDDLPTARPGPRGPGW